MKVAGKIFAVSAIISVILAAALPAAAQDQGGAANVKTFTIVAEQINKSKFWLPSTITVNQGDKVKLNLKNDVEGADNKHGFQIKDYNITEVVTRGVPTTVSFTADKAGIFPYICQLHPAHIGGELIVLPKSGS